MDHRGAKSIVRHKKKKIARVGVIIFVSRVHATIKGQCDNITIQLNAIKRNNTSVLQ